MAQSTKTVRDIGRLVAGHEQLECSVFYFIKRKYRPAVEKQMSAKTNEEFLSEKPPNC